MSLGDSPFDISSIVFNAMQSDGFSRDPNTGKCVGGVQNRSSSSQAQKGFWQRLGAAWGSLTTIAPQVSDVEVEVAELMV